MCEGGHVDEVLTQAINDLIVGPAAKEIAPDREPPKLTFRRPLAPGDLCKLRDEHRDAMRAWRECRDELTDTRAELARARPVVAAAEAVQDCDCYGLDCDDNVCGKSWTLEEAIEAYRKVTP